MTVLQASQLARAGNRAPHPGLNLFMGGQVMAAAQARGGLPPHVVRRLREHIDTNIDQRIAVKSLAQLANLSECYFVRAFKQSVGITPRGYLTRRRLERTMELLSVSDMSISEIALAAGFADQSHCARRFRQYVGMSPRDYRRASTWELFNELAAPAISSSLSAVAAQTRKRAPVPPETLLRRFPKACDAGSLGR
jgi:AraC-like DNA-binding protein